VNNPQEVSRVQVLKREVQIYQAAIVVAEAVLPFKCEERKQIECLVKEVIK